MKISKMKRSIARRHRRDSKYTEILGGLTFYKVSKNLVYASFITLAAVSIIYRLESREEMESHPPFHVVRP